jgi:hypothetical protein
MARKRLRHLSLPITRWNTGRNLPTVSRTNYRDRPADIAVVVQDDSEPDRRTVLHLTPEHAAKLIECLSEFAAPAADQVAADVG